jgi:phytoene dehydrogenase-like protein
MTPDAGLLGNAGALVGNLPLFPLLGKLNAISCAQLGARFNDPLLRRFFGDGMMGELSAIAILFSLAWMNAGNAGYPLGGSQAVIQAIKERLEQMGGHIRFQAKVKRILVENDRAVGVELEDGEQVRADWTISAADGLSTLAEMLGNKYTDERLRRAYAEWPLFPSYVQVSLGVGMDLRELPPMLTRILDKPLEVDPGTRLHQVSFRIFNFDPSFAPRGKTAVTCFLPTRNHDYWLDLKQKSLERYKERKRKIADDVMVILNRVVPHLRHAVEVADVSTPATVIRYTGNWKGSMEGWLLRPGGSFSPLPHTLKGLKNFAMAGQWVMPGGGLPSGLMTGRLAIKTVCRADGVKFRPKG